MSGLGDNRWRKHEQILKTKQDAARCSVAKK